jgi:hypothetical protein
MPYHVPSPAVPSSVVQGNDDGAEDEDLQVPDRTTYADVEQNEDEADGNYLYASNVFHIFRPSSLLVDINA